MITLGISLIWLGGFYFENATVYDRQLNSLKENVFLLVNETGTVRFIRDHPIPAPDDVVRIERALVLPHLTDFYCLIQERGLGFDEDIDAASQGRLARYLKTTGFAAVRDPIFPPLGLDTGFGKELKALAMRGYLEVPGGPSQGFSLIVEPDKPLTELWARIPEEGPISLWWSSAGTGVSVIWQQHPELINKLIELAHGKGRKIGCYIQDATASDMAGLAQFPFDFYEGIPAGDVEVDSFPDIVWIPLVSLNDRRYCAKFIHKRLADSAALGLYDAVTYNRAKEALENVAYRLRDRCVIWQKRREQTLASVKRWLAKRGALGIGSSAGHLFALTGDIRSELQILDELGATQPQLLRALFNTNPDLLGLTDKYLKQGKPANFIVYRDNGFWLHRIGTRADFNFVEGNRVDPLNNPFKP